MATLADVTQRQLGGGDGTDSISFLPHLRGTDTAHDEARKTLVLQSSRGLFSVRSGKWKYINGAGSGGFSGRDKPPASSAKIDRQLYDLEVDPGETTNLFLERPEVAKQLEADLQRTLAEGYWKS